MATRIAFLLFRKKLLPLLEVLPQTLLRDASLYENSQETLIERFRELVNEGLRWKNHGRTWYLHGTPKSKELLPILRKGDPHALSYLDEVNLLRRLSETCGWCLAPWGTYGTGQMIAFIFKEEIIFDKVMNWFQINTGNADLLVSTYTQEQLEMELFRGAIFRRSTELRGQGLWNFGRDSSEPILVLNYQSAEVRSQLPNGAEKIAEVHGYQFTNPVHRSWIRIRNEEAFLHFAAQPSAVMFAGGELDERLMWLALQEFAGVAEHINQDPLHFALKILTSTSWVYVPTSDDEKWEIYINQNPQVTKRFLESQEMTRAPFFLHKYSC